MLGKLLQGVVGLSLLVSTTLFASPTFAQSGTASISADTRAVADGINALKGQKPAKLAGYVSQQAKSRQMSGIFIIDSAGRSLLETRKAQGNYEIPSSEMLKGVIAGKIIVSTNNHSKLVIAVTKLAAFADAYLVLERAA